MNDVIADTHAVIWHFSSPAQLSPNAESALDNAELNGIIYVSAITIIELVYLTEKNKIPFAVLDLLRDALDDSASAFRLMEITRNIADELANIPRHIIPDMPDRIIAATALFLGIPLITRDTEITKLTTIQIIW